MNRPTVTKSPTSGNNKEIPMTEEIRKALDRISKGNLIECSTELYRSEIRDALVRFALACVDNNDTARMRITLVEMNRLDKTHGYGTSAGSPDNLA
jgi:hypothetical protein